MENKYIIYNKMLESKIVKNFRSKLENIEDIQARENEPITLYYIKNFSKKVILDKYDIESNLYNEKVGLFENIQKRIEILKFTLTKEDNKILDNFKKFSSFFDQDIFVMNENIFYSKYKMSIYSPHILKEKNNITSIFLDENQRKLSIYDFQYMYSHNKNGNIFQELLEKRVSQFNEKFLDEKIYGFYDNYMYTIFDNEIIKNKLKLSTMKKLTENLLPNQSEIYFNISNNNEDNENNEDFVLFENISYLKGLSFEQKILYSILTRLKTYHQLPNIIFYECYMNIFGERIIKSEDKIHPGYQEIDYALYSLIDFCFEEIDFPLYVQSEYYYDNDNNNLIKNEKEHIFKILKDRIYFFEFKSSLNYYTMKNNVNYKKSKDPNVLLYNLIKKCKDFANLYMNALSIHKDTQIEIILFYDDKYSSILDNCFQTIKNMLKGEKIRFSVVYVLTTYSYMSLVSMVEKSLETEKKVQNLSNTIEEMKEENSNLSNKVKELEKDNKNLSNKVKELEKDNKNLSNIIKEMENEIKKIKMGIDNKTNIKIDKNESKKESDDKNTKVEEKKQNKGEN